MFNVQELERKWIKYKIRSYALYIFLSLILVITAPLGMILYHSSLHVNDKNTTLSIQDINKSVNSNNSSAEVNATQNNLPSDDKLVLHPSLSFVDNMGNSINTYYNDKPYGNTKTNIENVPAPKIKQIPEKKAIEEPAFPIVVPDKNTTNSLPKDIKNKKIQIEVHNVDDDLQDVIQRFKKTNNPTLGLFLAKRYYDMQKYNLSYNYALLTNQIDSKIDMSWIIFTKSLVKLGQKDMAVNTLKLYIKNSNSKQAATLLDEIESGRFK